MSFAATRETSIGQKYLEALIQGNRRAARAIVADATSCGVDAYELLNKLVWPVMEQIQQLYREDRISKVGLNLATRLNRMIAEQAIARLEPAEANGKKVAVFCGDDEPEELGGAICAALFEASGWDVRFAGGGVPNDEILGAVGHFRPDLLVLFATRPSGMPAVRQLIDYLREVNSSSPMRVLCCGGIYKRAEGLAEEIGADLFAPDAADAVRVASENPLRRATPDQQTVGRPRNKRQKPQAA